jgi:hypothetical protein
VDFTSSPYYYFVAISRKGADDVAVIKALKDVYNNGRIRKQRGAYTKSYWCLIEGR